MAAFMIPKLSTVVGKKKKNNNKKTLSNLGISNQVSTVKPTRGIIQIV